MKAPCVTTTMYHLTAPSPLPQVHAMDWWTGGFTDRMPMLRKLQADAASTPWELVREQWCVTHHRL